MEGSLDTMPLVDVLELIHMNRQTGVLSVKAELPLLLRFSSGEVVGGEILDWQGFEAVSTFPLYVESGQFAFVSARREGTPWMPFQEFITEWARLNDEWFELISNLHSSLRIVEALHEIEPYTVFIGGKSIQKAARIWKVPLIEAMRTVKQGLKQRNLALLSRYSWQSMKISYPEAFFVKQDPEVVTSWLNGQRSLAEIIAAGVPEEKVRCYLITALRNGNVVVPQQRGWFLRNLLWEAESIAKQPKQSPRLSPPLVNPKSFS